MDDDDTNGRSTHSMTETPTDIAVEDLTLDELREFLDERGIAVFKHPERLEILQSLPRTEVGKISKADLEERLTRMLKDEGELPEDY